MCALWCMGIYMHMFKVQPLALRVCRGADLDLNLWLQPVVRWGGSWSRRVSGHRGPRSSRGRWPVSGWRRCQDWRHRYCLLLLWVNRLSTLCDILRHNRRCMAILSTCTCTCILYSYYVRPLQVVLNANQPACGPRNLVMILRKYSTRYNKNTVFSFDVRDAIWKRLPDLTCELTVCAWCFSCSGMTSSICYQWRISGRSENLPLLLI